MIVPYIPPAQSVNNFDNLERFRLTKPIERLLNANKKIVMPQLEDMEGNQIVALRNEPPYEVAARAAGSLLGKSLAFPNKVAEEKLGFPSGSEPPYQRMTRKPTRAQKEEYGKSPVGYYTAENTPRMKARRSDEISYISEQSGLPKLKYVERRGPYRKYGVSREITL